MLETLLLVFVTGVSVIAALLINYARWNYGSLEKLGIPVAKPHWLLGSDPDGHNVTQQETDLERYKKFGPVYGIYEGRTPKIFVLDPDMIRHIMVKDFDHFYDRTPVNWGHEIVNNLLDFLPGEKWKTMRSGLTPMFTSSRIRNGGKVYSQIMEKYVTKLKEEHKGESMKFDLKEFMTPVFVEFTYDYFLSLQLSEEGNIKENYLYKMALESVGEGMEASFFFTLINAFPFMMKFIPVFPTAVIYKFLITLEEAMKLRRERAEHDTSTGKDFIDVMISMSDKLDTPEYKRLGIKKATVQAQAFEMFIAGYDSIIGTLSILPYYITKNPEIQEKLLDELDNAEKDGSVSDLPYLTACVKETIRLSPSFHRLDRMCMKEWTYNNGKDIKVTIPKETSIIIPAWATNRNPEVFKDPEEFRPERFYKKGDGEGDDGNEKKQNSQYAMNSFGHGPRNCVGMRMGIEMIKAGMSRMLKEFKFEARDDTKAELIKGLPMITRYRPIYTNLVRRSAAKEE